VRSLVEAWKEVPRDLIIASFQRTNFRTDDCFLEIRCDAWEDLDTGISFRKFVTFDDYLSANASHKQYGSTSRSHDYNLRTRKAVRFDDPLNFAINSKEKDLIVDYALVNENLKNTYVKKNVDWKRRNSLKRSHDEAQLDEDLYEETKSSDESTSRENEDIPTSTRSSKVIDVQMTESLIWRSNSDDVHSTTQASVNESRTDTEYDHELNKTADNEERCKNSRVLSNERSIGSLEVDNANDGNITSQQVFNGTSNAADLDTKEPNAKVISCATPRDETVDLDENVRFSRKSLKRRFINNEESRNNSDDDEPEQKRLKSDSDWMKQYETTFVFGPFDLARTTTTVSTDTLTISDSGVPQPRPRRLCETERSIFTIRPRRD